MSHVLSNCVCSRMFTSWKKWRNNEKKWNWKMQIWKRHTWQLQKKWESKMQVEKGAKIANGGKIERANATWKGAHLTNEEYMEGTNASWKEATSYVENIDRWNATREKGKCQMQHTWKHQISLDKVVKPAQKTKETLNLKREVRGEPVKPKKTPNVEAHACQVDRWPAEREGPRSELGTYQNWILFERNRKKLN